MEEYHLQAVVQFNAVGCATGSIKQKKFQKFLDGLKTKKVRSKVDVSKTMKNLKKANISIEEK